MGMSQQQGFLVGSLWFSLVPSWFRWCVKRNVRQRTSGSVHMYSNLCTAEAENTAQHFPGLVSMGTESAAWHFGLCSRSLR